MNPSYSPFTYLSPSQCDRTAHIETEPRAGLLFPAEDPSAVSMRVCLSACLCMCVLSSQAALRAVMAKPKAKASLLPWPKPKPKEKSALLPTAYFTVPWPQPKAKRETGPDGVRSAAQDLDVMSTLRDCLTVRKPASLLLPKQSGSKLPPPNDAAQAAGTRGASRRRQMMLPKPKGRLALRAQPVRLLIPRSSQAIVAHLPLWSPRLQSISLASHNGTRP